MNLILQQSVRHLLNQLPVDAENEHFKNTPLRVEEAWNYLLGGYDESPVEIIQRGMFSCSPAINDLIIVKGIEFSSVCAHHLLPFYGVCHVGYLPRVSMLGLSKFSRVVDAYARRLTLQEILTSNIATTLDGVLDPIGLGVVIEASHLCMACRGVKQRHSPAVTSSLRGEFHSNPNLRAEFLSLIEK